MHTNLTNYFLSGIHNTGEAEISGVVDTMARKCLLDFFCMTLTRASLLKGKEQQKNEGQSHVIGRPHTASANT